MSDLDRAIDTAQAMAGALWGFGLAAALFALVLVGFYVWFVPKRSARVSAQYKPMRRDPAAFMEGAP